MSLLALMDASVGMRGGFCTWRGSGGRQQTMTLASSRGKCTSFRPLSDCHTLSHWGSDPATLLEPQCKQSAEFIVFSADAASWQLISPNHI